jgi:hypothetical protein
MNTRQNERPWQAIDLAELKYGLAFGSSVEEIADFLQREVADVHSGRRRSAEGRKRCAAALTQQRRPDAAGDCVGPQFCGITLSGSRGL